MHPKELDNFKAKNIFSMESDDCTIRVATSVEDLKLALRLRHKVFLEEGLGRRHQSGLEFDSYDQKADHLMIVDNTSGEAIGTYRLIHSNFSDRFYSQGEFELDEFLKIEGSKLELGRACTHKDRRDGRTMNLLWQGLSRYIVETKTRFLFGCSSIDSIDPSVVFSVTKSLQAKEHLSFKHQIQPTEKYAFEDPDSHLDQAEEDRKILRTLPPLLRSYLHAGSLVYGYPALDKDFSCADLLTILDLRNLNRKFKERFLPDFEI